MKIKEEKDGMNKLGRHTEFALLDIFIYREDDMRPSLEKPMEQNGYICATDTHIAVRIKKEMLTGEYEQRDAPNFARVFPAIKPKYSITFEAILEAIAKCKLSETLYVDCPECGGSGEVDWHYYDKDGDTHTREDECPVCGGDGMAFNGLKEFIFLGNEYAFQAYYLICIVKAMRLLGVKTISVAPNNCHAWLFVPCEGVQIILMPRSTYPTKVEASAKIKLIKNT